MTGFHPLCLSKPPTPSRGRGSLASRLHLNPAIPTPFCWGARYGDVGGLTPTSALDAKLKGKRPLTSPAPKYRLPSPEVLYMMYFGLKVLSIWLLLDLSIRYVGTWTLWVQNQSQGPSGDYKNKRLLLGRASLDL